MIRITISAAVLLSLYVMPCQAATPTGQAAITNILWRGVAPDQGYGHFKWGDRPTPSVDVNCSPSAKDDNGISPKSECTATANLPNVGMFRAISAKYVFKWEQLVRIEIKLAMPPDSGTKMPDDLPNSINVVSSEISTSFFHSAKSEEASLTIFNLDLGRRVILSKIAYEKIDRTSPDLLEEYHRRLALECAQCEAVLTDYEQVVSPDKPISAEQAKSLMVSSPQITYLMALSTLVSRNDSFYQMALDRMRVNSSFLNDIGRR